MDKKIWTQIAVILLASNTIGLIILMEMVVFKFPYLSLFLVILSLSIYINSKVFKIKLFKSY